jgi:HD-GYP domain-containing protein (c-di-GMP phosphodiesterase class II)
MVETTAKSQPRVIKVEEFSGEADEKVRLFLPLPPDALMIKRPVYFDVYQKLATDEIKMLLPKGHEIPSDLRNLVRQQNREAAKSLYVPANQKDEMYRYEQDILPDLLADESVPVLAKCNVLQKVTSHLSHEMFESPTPLNIQRQRENVEQMVDFTLQEPVALKALLGLTHHDYYTYTHSVNVGLYALTISIEHLFKTGDASEDVLKRMAAGFFLHDIGKSRVPSEVINKNGPLNETEWAEMRRHPAYGHELLQEEGHLTVETATIVLQHHEKMTGSGYPDSLKGTDIHIFARICCVADAFDALTTKRSYKAAVKPFDALTIMKKDMYTQFDPEVFQTFVLLMRRKAA